MAHTFKGGIHPPGMKELTKGKPIESLPAPDHVILPVSMHIGAPCEPLVKAGDYVYMGQKIADSKAPVSAPVHATVSGNVIAVEPRLHPNGQMVMSIVIENDKHDAILPELEKIDPSTIERDEIVRRIREAGIVGHGGAAFPTHFKISTGIGKVDTVIINGSECEPYITSDYRIMTEYPWEVIGGIELLGKLFETENVFLGIEDNKADVIPGLEKQKSEGSPVKIVPLTTKYPQGAEKQLINSITGREVPSGKLPADAGCAVFNIDTAASIYRLFVTGMPMVRRIVTVSGSAVVEPKNLEVRIGTPISELLEYCRGFKEPPTKLLMGGPMMGVAQFSVDVPVIKGTNAILAFCEDECVLSPDPTCIRCGRCVDHCPMGLLPTYFYLNFEKGRYDECERLNILDCMECGACTYICPGKLPLVQSIRAGKAKVLASRKK